MIIYEESRNFVLRFSTSTRLSHHVTHMNHNKMPKIKAKTLRREKMLLEHFNKFNNLKKEDQILNIDYFAVELGCYASDLDAKDYEKVPPPELNEIEENESVWS